MITEDSQVESKIWEEYTEEQILDTFKKGQREKGE